jgi:hypothetical protein
VATTNDFGRSYLKRILASVEVRDFSAPFRTDFDNWFAFREGGPFLNGNSRPHWHNHPCPDKHGVALRRAHFVSHAAARTLGGIARERLMKDHAIPVAVLRDLLFDRQPDSIEQVRAVLLRHYRFGVITEQEDRLLNAAGLRSRMPEGWTPNDGPFARYEKVGIAGQDGGQGPAASSSPPIQPAQRRQSFFASQLNTTASKRSAEGSTNG